MHMFYRNVINILYIPIKQAYNQSCHGPLAQLAEHLTLNQGVQGSNPWWSTKINPHYCAGFSYYCLQTGSRRSRESLNHPLCGCGNESYTKKSPCLSIMQVFKPHYMQKKGDFIWQQRHRALRTQNGYANTTQYLHLSIDVKLYIINTEIVYVKY